jgi:hypothetical protein
MPAPLKITLIPEQRHQLEDIRDHHPKPYLRERAAAILKVAQGQSCRQVALQGLLKPRRADTVQEWVHRFQQEGIAGLLIRPGRGRKPAFSPSAFVGTRSSTGPAARYPA